MKEARNVALFTVLALALLAQGAAAFELFCGKENCFEILGMTRETANMTAIKKAYRKASLELHPDRNPSKDADKQFQRIANAYQVLTNEKKRAEYEDFLDHPENYYWYFLEHMSETYAAKADAKIVLFGIVSILTLLHYLNMSLNYKSAMRRIKDTPDYKERVAALVKNGEAHNIDEAEAKIKISIVGFFGPTTLRKPTWRDLLFIQAPVGLARFLYRVVRWQVRYKLMKKEYTEEDKIMLIKKAFQLDETDWEEIPESDKEEMISRKVWEEKAKSEFIRDKRFESKGASKRKPKPKRYRPPPEYDY
mmetsp:Transcript_8631/g.25931  ORF Transcript_8631/g.25931 Transcript_8631/m.25931 type:complete len:307 (+) Transcript_8631:110-1030(+)|eukprot:CAMPEP_0198737484 /NCGR_PEP_ID=MMETSP1475-20131203/67887_1 /TAXON_ID= ORGANISM="Unidentified sp., Strain CCMP1999" /NCGR_SAMPLE_ID=MMETSP1475 /ASSEMBLY_ACC=CAM_ASM_001111 /LENGTH=306 /DNA_ID=CAMNT_0044501349 /DNA_START=109 /DNA_END=1029 /DNA_ORIENTATION=+